MLRWILAAIGIVVLSMSISATAMYLSEAPSRRPYDPQAHERSRQLSLQYESVSLVRLLASPERYDGQKVRVSGFLTLEHEGSGLHLDRASYDAGLRKNAVWLDQAKPLDPKDVRRLTRRYAEVAATFDASNLGAYSHHSGALTNVRNISPTYTTAEYEQWRLRERRDLLIQNLLSGWFLTVVGWTGLFVYWLLRSART